MEPMPATSRTRRGLATALAIVAIVLALICLGFILASWEVPTLQQSFGPRGFAVAYAVTLSIMGWILATRRPENPIGWLSLGAAIASGFQGLSAAYALWAFVGHGSRSVLAQLAAVGEEWIWLIAFGAFGLMLCVFPDGHTISRAWRRWMVGLAVVTGIGIVALAMTTKQLVHTTAENPLGVPGMYEVGSAASMGFFGLVVLGFASLVVRYRRTTGDEHEQMKWLAASSALVVGSFSIYLIWYLVTWARSGSTLAPVSGGAVGDWMELVITASILLVPVSIAIGVLKYRLYDIDVVIRKAVVYAILVGLILAVAGIGIAVVGALVVGPLGDSGAALLVVGLVIGASLWPLRRLATRLADRVVFGGRRTPYEVMHEFSQRLAETYAADDVLQRLARMSAEVVGARAGFVWLSVDGETRVVAAWPGSAATTELGDTVPILHQGAQLGALGVDLPANDPMTPSKQSLLAELASQAGLVLRNVLLLEELRESRRRIVTAQDERARKLERDIHDGAQQQLVALAVKQRLASAMIGKDDERAVSMMADLQVETTDALENLRDLARGIYPPLLADQGLPAALEAQARKNHLPTTVASDGVGRFPQEVESAIYFSVIEAWQNTSKYANAATIEVDLAETDSSLMFSVTDDGAGFDTSATSFGTGLRGISDRLAAIGGSIEIDSESGRGTTIAGTVPLQT